MLDWVSVCLVDWLSKLGRIAISSGIASLSFWYVLSFIKERENLIEE